MDSKRKANGHAAVEVDDRSAKRRKLAEFDLSKAESRESTTAYGNAFLEQIRRTQDKSGRLVATYFEKLLPRAGNEEYYKRTRMPIALETVEEKLSKGYFKNLAELESYFKRMIANAKEFYPRSSAVFDDAERVRKALSNYMTKNNPAYQTRNYQAVATPLPPENGEEEQGQEEEQEQKQDEELDATDDDAKGEDEEKEGGNVKEEEDRGEDEEEEGEEEEEEEEEQEEQEAEPTSRRRPIILKRNGPGRLSRNSTGFADSPRRAKPNGRPDYEYHNVPFKGLSFQQAQEKLVEELLRYKEPEYDGFFEPFVNLPPRSLKDYYRVVADPLSLKKLQKEVLGIQGRGEPTGISVFKSWSALEDRAKLLWTNAYFYNEEGSEIYDLAQELEKAFNELLNKARAAVQEPTQAKIKLKVGQNGAAASSKRTTQSVESPSSGSLVNGTAKQTAALNAPPSASLSVSSPSPSAHPGLKAEENSRLSPAVSGQTTTKTVMGPATPMAQPPATPGPPLMQSTNPMANGYLEPKRLRAPGKGIQDALISRLRIQLHPSTQAEQPVLLDILPLPREMSQSATVNLPASINRVFILAQLPDFLQDRQYSLWLLVDKQPLKPCLQPLPNQLLQERAFDVMLHPGINVIEAHLIAAVPRHERENAGGSEVELEIFTAFANVLRH